MLAIAVRYLTGRAVATDPADYAQAEWPPHPGRVFMALVAAHHATGADPAERQALLWLEQQPPPALAAPAAFQRGVVTCYVPVNDTRVPSRLPAGDPSAGLLRQAMAVLPSSRPRQPRHFPSVTPVDERVFFLWRESDPSPGCRRALAALCGKVTYLGHSSSLVQVMVCDRAPEPTLAPVPDGVGAGIRLRVAGTDRLADLEALFAAGRRPTPGLAVGYAAPPGQAPRPLPGTVFEPNIVVFRRISGPRLGLETTLALTAALRNAAMRHAIQPVPEVISGHQPDGTPSQRAHLACFPLPDVGHAHARGHIAGLGVALPGSIPPDARQACLAALAPVTTLAMGRIGAWEVEPEQRADTLKALTPDTWTRPADRWATVTPIVLDRFPKADGDAEESIALACQRVGLPPPVSVAVSSVSAHLGVPAATSFAPMPSAPGKPRRWHCHAAIRLPRQARGPVLLGAGRYRGYGLCRPVLGLKGGD